jgi:hypothetical protein
LKVAELTIAFARRLLLRQYRHMSFMRYDGSGTGQEIATPYMDRRTFLLLTSAALANGLSTASASDASAAAETAEWELFIEQPDQDSVLVGSFALPEKGERVLRKSLAGFHVEAKIQRIEHYWSFSARVSSAQAGRACFLSLSRAYSEPCRPANFNGEVIESDVFRQSPHYPMAEYTGRHLQPLPMVGLETPTGVEIAISNTPALYDNFTSQTFDLKARKVALASGDRALHWDAASESFVKAAPQSDAGQQHAEAIEPHFFPLDAAAEHKFEAIFLRFPEAELAALRQQVNLGVTRRWSLKPLSDLLGSTYFATAYMNLRANEAQPGHYWVVPAIEYADHQYSRDAFWISMMLPPEYSQSCFENEAANDKEFTGAERQLFTLVWAYRNHLNGFPVDKSRVERILRIVEAQAPNGYYSGFSTKTRVPGCWQGWADTVAFDRDDSVSNNQGLFVVALLCAEALGIAPKVSIEQATVNYRNLFNTQLNAYPLSLQRTNILAVDPLMGDLLAQVFLDKKLLPTEHVLAHYRAMRERAKTANGFKIFCAPDGSYLRHDQYNSKEFTAAMSNPTDGGYQCGGSWYLYDMQMLMDAYLHGAADAEDEMIWRTKLEFASGGTTHEYIDTVTGKAYKPNMGWNAGTYAMWRQLILKGKATDRFFREIDSLRAV